MPTVFVVHMMVMATTLLVVIRPVDMAVCFSVSYTATALAMHMNLVCGLVVRVLVSVLVGLGPWAILIARSKVVAMVNMYCSMMMVAPHMTMVYVCNWLKLFGG